MLVLSRRVNERLLIPSVQAAIQIVAIKPGMVRLGIEAPADVKVYREEIYEAPANLDPPAASAAAAKLGRLRHLVRNRLNNFALGLALLRRYARTGAGRSIETTIDKIEQELQALSDDFGAELEASETLPEPLITEAGSDR